MSVASMRSVFGHLAGLASAVITRLVAGGTGDNTPIYTAELDARTLTTPLTTESAGVAVVARATLTAAATLTVTVDLQHTEDADFNTPANITTVNLGTITLTGPGGGGEDSEAALYAFQPTAYQNRQRIRVTPNLSAANTDIAEVSAALLMSGLSHSA